MANLDDIYDTMIAYPILVNSFLSDRELVERLSASSGGGPLSAGSGNVFDSQLDAYVAFKREWRQGNVLSLSRSQKDLLRDFLYYNIRWREPQLAWLQGRLPLWLAATQGERQAAQERAEARLKEQALRGTRPCPPSVPLVKQRRRPPAAGAVLPIRPLDPSGVDAQLVELFKGRRLQIKRTQLRDSLLEIVTALDECTGGHVAELLAQYGEEALAMVISLTPQLILDFIASATPIMNIIKDGISVGMSLWSAASQECARRRVIADGQVLENPNAQAVCTALERYAREQRNESLQAAAVDAGAALAKGLGLAIDLGVLSGTLIAAAQAIYNLAAALHAMKCLLEERDKINRALTRGVQRRHLAKYPLVAAHAVLQMDTSWLLGLGEQSGARQDLTPEQIMSRLPNISNLQSLSEEILDDSPFEFST